MASLELWHAERIDTAQIWSALGAVRATLGYNPYGLPLHAPHLLNDGMVLDWVQATLLHSGAATLVPRVVAEHDLTVRDEWAPPVFLRSRAGLAAGNTHAEAVLHALYELLAHDAAAAMQEAPERHHVLDLSTVDSDDARRLLDRFASAAVAVTVYDITGDTGVAAFEVVAESHSPHVVARGRACHLDPAVALCRALAAAARERLALLTGVRDDIPVVSTATPPRSSRDTAERQPGMPTRSFADIPSRSTTSFAGDIAELCARIEARGAGPAIVVDLSRESIGLPVVRVVVPELGPDNGARAA
jgi:ribosomal protein S12 methylthiotransferase accessory factor